MDAAELTRRFAFHSATTTKRIDDHASVRAGCADLAGHLNTVLPESREKDEAIKHLEHAMFWANAAIARQPE